MRFSISRQLDLNAKTPFLVLLVWKPLAIVEIYGKCAR